LEPVRQVFFGQYNPIFPSKTPLLRTQNLFFPASAVFFRHTLVITKSCYAMIEKRFPALGALLLFVSIGLSAQNFSNADALARSTPFPKKQDLSGLAQALGKGLSTEKEKVRAFYVWIAANIEYDIKTFENRKEIEYEEWREMQAPQQVLKSKRAVCDGYSNLFVALCETSDIAAFKVSGQVKNSKGRVARVSHAWVLVRADEQWGLADPTWGAGDVDADEGKYIKRFKADLFFTDPSTLIVDHYPEDPLFQLLPTPLRFEEFKQDRAVLLQSLKGRSGLPPQPGYEAIKDSLNAYVALDSSSQFFNSCLRTLRADSTSAKGQYGSALLRFNQINASIVQVFEEANKAFQTKNREVIAQALDKCIPQITDAEATLRSCMSTLEKVSGTGPYIKPARQLQSTVKSAMAQCAQNKSNLEQTRAQIRN